MSDLLDVFKDFEYEDEPSERIAQDRIEYDDNFSQILMGSEDEAQNDEQFQVTSSEAVATGEEKFDDPLANLPEYEEAFRVLKSIEAAHRPLSYTSVFAYLHYKRRHECNKRTVPGMVWPEHPETLQQSRLYSSQSAPEPPKDFVEMAQNERLRKALLRTCDSICQHRPHAPLLDPLMAASIAHRTTILLQASFNRALTNRKSAIIALRAFDGVADFDNVPGDWESVREAVAQLVNQVGLDAETFQAFSSKLDETFVVKK